MNINQVLNSLGKKWSKSDLLNDIRNGKEIKEIVNEYIKGNEKDLIKLNIFLSSKHPQLLDQISKVTECELKLIEKIKQLDDQIPKNEFVSDKIKTTSVNDPIGIELFFYRWSNKFVVFILILISLVSLNKQAWL